MINETAPALPRDRTLISSRGIPVLAGSKVCVLIAVLLVELVAPLPHPWLTIQLLLSVAALDSVRVVSTVNFALAYHFLALGIGPLVVPVRSIDSVHAFGAGLAAAIGIGAAAGRFFSTAAQAGSEATVRPGAERARARSVTLLRACVVIQGALITLSIIQVGPSGYLAGLTLSGSITTYAAGGLGAVDIAEYGVGLLATALVAVHVSACRDSRDASWGLVTLVLVVMPLFALARSSAFVGTVMLLFIRSFANRDGHGRRVRGVASILAAVLIVLTASVGLGILRERALAQSTGAGSSSSSVLTSEFSTVVVVDLALSTGAPRFGPQAFLVPLATRFVPRRIYPEKPQSATTRVMISLDPSAFRAGYSLAPTAVGSALLYFGGVVTLVLAALVAGAAAAFDRRRVWTGVSAGLGAIIAYHLYNLLRNDLVNSVSEVSLLFVVFFVLRYLITGRPEER